jgi:3-hydroxyisobutyrate dehydrogenase
VSNSTENVVPVGFVGVGNQGGPIAMRIAKAGLPLMVWARRPEVLAEYEAAGVRAASSLAELGRACDLVAICVTTDDDVRAVTLGPAGLLANMASGSSLAVHSTVHPDTVREVAETAREGRVSVVDAPVSGGNLAAQAGTLAVLLGGHPDDIDRWRPVFSTFATSVEVLGDVGAGQLCKLVNNALSAANLAGALRALGAAVELGLDPDAVARVLMASSGDSFMLRMTPRMAESGLGLAADRYAKDVALFEDVAGDAGADATALASVAKGAVEYFQGLTG